MNEDLKELTGADLDYDFIHDNMMGKQYKFTASCKMFNGFMVYGTVTNSWVANNGELMMDVRTPQGKRVSIGSNMKGLKIKPMPSLDC